MSPDTSQQTSGDKHRFVLKIEYDGTDFCGWQVQDSDRTVQGEIEKSLKKLYGSDIRIAGAGRTDSGVHAAGQIAHFDADAKHDAATITRALNFYLPDDVKIISCQETSPEFHARFSAKWRYYIYRLYKQERALFRQYGWHSRDSIDLSRLNEAADLFNGDHDFTAFCAVDAVDDHHRCQVHKAYWIELADEYQFHIVANRFLKHMVRMLVGVSLDVSRGRFPVETISTLFASGDKGNLVITAPPQGLYLMTVGLGDFPFVDPDNTEQQNFPEHR